MSKLIRWQWLWAGLCGAVAIALVFAGVDYLFEPAVAGLVYRWTLLIVANVYLNRILLRHLIRRYLRRQVMKAWEAAKL